MPIAFIAEFDIHVNAILVRIYNFGFNSYQHNLESSKHWQKMTHYFNIIPKADD